MSRTDSDPSKSVADTGAEPQPLTERPAASDTDQSGTGAQVPPQGASEPEAAGPSNAYPSLPSFSGPIADSDPVSGSTSDTDSAIGDFVSTRSESLRSSAYQYRNENGRRYHAYRDGFEYNLPNDEQELDRLDLQHHLFNLTLDGKLHRAPLDELSNGVQNVLDIGTGTGIWAIDFADQYGSAKVVGTDLSPVQPAYVPPNCHFYVDDASADWTWEEPFDYIHGRMLVVAVKDWPRFFEQAYANLAPGGWVEIQDMNFPLRCDDGSAASDSHVLQWSAKMLEGAANLGVQLDATNDFPRIMSEVGFTDIRVERYAWPLNRWPKAPKEKEKGMWCRQNIQEGLQGFTVGIFTRGLGWRAEEVEVYLVDVRKDMNDRKKHSYLPIGVFMGRKPL